MMLTSDLFQIISLIGFPKPQIFIFSPVLKALCDNTAALLKQRRPRKQTQRRVRRLWFTRDARKEMRRRPSPTAGYVRNTRERGPKPWSDDGAARSPDQPKASCVFPLDEVSVVGAQRGLGFHPL